MIQMRLKEILEEKQRSLYWLSMESGVRYATIWNFNKGDFEALRMETLDRICKALECQPGDLLVRVEERETKQSKKRSANKRSKVTGR